MNSTTQNNKPSHESTEEKSWCSGTIKNRVQEFFKVHPKERLTIEELAEKINAKRPGVSKAVGRGIDGISHKQVQEGQLRFTYVWFRQGDNGSHAVNYGVTRNLSRGNKECHPVDDGVTRRGDKNVTQKAQSDGRTPPSSGEHQNHVTVTAHRDERLIRDQRSPSRGDSGVDSHDDKEFGDMMTNKSHPVNHDVTLRGDKNGTFRIPTCGEFEQYVKKNYRKNPDFAYLNKRYKRASDNRTIQRVLDVLRIMQEEGN